MKKRVIIIAALVIALLGVYFAVDKLSVEKDDDGQDEYTPRETISIFKTEKDNIVSMTVSTPDHEYTFYKDEDIWKVRGAEHINLVNVRVDNLAYDFSSINADVIIEDTGDLSLFGFDKPVGTPSIELSDGSVVKFVIGSKIPTGTGYYFKTEDSDSVYTVYSSKIESFIAPLETYRNRTLATIDVANLTEIRIKRADANIVLRLKTEDEPSESGYNLNPWRMISPHSRDVNSYTFEKSILEKLTGFEVRQFIDDNPVSYQQYGLATPKYVIGFTEFEKPPVNFLLGNYADDDEIYVRLENENAVYTVNSSVFAYKDIEAISLVDTLAYIQMIDTVDSITLTAGSEKFILRLTRQGEDTTYYINDLVADESEFKKVYQEIIGLLIRDEITENVDAQPIFTAVFSFNDGRADDVVEGFPYRDRYAAIRINGVSQYYVMRERVTGMIDKVREFSLNPTKQ